MSSHSEPNPTANQSAPVVLVTGAAKRLGREIALALAKHGWQVAVHYRSSKQDAMNTIAYLATNTPATGQKHHIFQCDLAD
ncbi:MAG: SDR family NAD(P)-dependent oxidoreductase, partial [Polaromonas sp.]|nr:SDR family NAD(P)-dependent oxidoreductase [Polaromonas sp.]